MQFLGTYNELKKKEVCDAWNDRQNIQDISQLNT